LVVIEQDDNRVVLGSLRHGVIERTPLEIRGGEVREFRIQTAGGEWCYLSRIDLIELGRWCAQQARRQ
jgi:hypothetical protein